MKLDDWFPEYLGLGDDWEIEDIDCSTDPMNVDVHVRFVSRPICPVCGAVCTRYDTRPRHWRDMNFGRATINIYARVPRSNCKDHGPLEVDVPWAGLCSRLTRSFELVCYRYSMVMPPKLVQELLGVDDDTVWKIVFNEYGIRSEGLDLSDLSCICIDETQSGSGQNFITIVSDPAKGRIVYGTVGRDWTTLGDLYLWILRHNGHPDNIKYISADMSESFEKGIRIFFPEARIVYDHFHVHKMANEAIDRVRRTCGLKGKVGKGIRFKFLRNGSDLTSEDREKVESVLDRYSDLAVAYMIKESIVDFYSDMDIKHAGVMLRNIIVTGKNSGVKEIEKLCDTLDRHFEGIVLWHETSLNNGLAEGLNSVIQSMKTASRGFRNPSSMIALAFLRSEHKYELRKISDMKRRALPQ